MIVASDLLIGSVVAVHAPASGDQRPLCITLAVESGSGASEEDATPSLHEVLVDGEMKRVCAAEISIGDSLMVSGRLELRTWLRCEDAASPRRMQFIAEHIGRTLAAASTPGSSENV